MYVVAATRPLLACAHSAALTCPAGVVAVTLVEAPLTPAGAVEAAAGAPTPCSAEPECATTRYATSPPKTAAAAVDPAIARCFVGVITSAGCAAACRWRCAATRP